MLLSHFGKKINCMCSVCFMMKHYFRNDCNCRYYAVRTDLMFRNMGGSNVVEKR